MTSLAHEAAGHFATVLEQAASKYPNVIAVTHVPPFREAAWYKGKVSSDDYLPHLACKVVGDVMLAVMREHLEFGACSGRIGKWRNGFGRRHHRLWRSWWFDRCWRVAGVIWLRRWWCGLRRCHGCWRRVGVIRRLNRWGSLRIRIIRGWRSYIDLVRVGVRIGVAAIIVGRIVIQIRTVERNANTNANAADSDSDANANSHASCLSRRPRPRNRRQDKTTDQQSFLDRVQDLWVKIGQFNGGAGVDFVRDGRTNKWCEAKGALAA